MGHLFDLAQQAAQLEQTWRSQRLARVGDASLKLLRMDAQAYPDETHAYAEGLLVLEGELRLDVAGEAVTVAAGQLCMVPAGVPHAVLPGSSGTLLIIDA
ncbi:MULTISPECIES: cupin domain-containing protein [Rhodanobacter]|uniref:cupin domain-containing protein n=1 Tax=Rhodanobacter TaxID=75309 RepID=UPI000260DDCA|nr:MULTISPECIES: cupin domain-containing protein [Rhodanobacter]EIL99791.1 cupin [Rhodanobacter denitrificans]KZC20289.1 cupin [Rhodanobacter denitrificans]UJJ50718.1 cupin domain-containing protein [Rhodanobacter denitrificans]UJJ57082.1 cupin domain-containing protein [Rhodanobacter denitrificans]UJM90954.1 cupin domain-containing protein [Rhodanobacter denitrificans]